MTEHCLFCGGRVHTDLAHSCEHCGAVRDTLDEKRVHAHCPRCHDVRLIQFALGPVAMQACSRCKGSFLPASEWDTLLDTFTSEPLPSDIVIPDEESQQQERVSPYRAAAIIRAPSSSDLDLEERVSCPTCAHEMERLEFAGITGVIVDVCRSHGIWFDRGELARVVDANQTQDLDMDAHRQVSALTHARAPERGDLSVPPTRPKEAAASASRAEALSESLETPSREVVETVPIKKPATSLLHRLSLLVRRLVRLTSSTVSSLCGLP